jgi:hypothetical protein
MSDNVHEGSSTVGEWRWAAVMAGIAAAAFWIGSVWKGSPAHAADQFVLPQVIVRATPPSATMSRDGFVVVGASDDRYYQVLPDGSAVVVKDRHGRDVCWRKPGE